jgi:hypothetical protein
LKNLILQGHSASNQSENQNLKIINYDGLLSGIHVCDALFMGITEYMKPSIVSYKKFE